MTRSAVRFLLRASHVDGKLMARFVSASLARCLVSMGILVLMQQFLAGVLAGTSDVASSLAAPLSQTAGLWTAAGLLMLCFLASSALTFEGRMVEQRIIRAFELGLLDRLVRHLLTLSVGFFDRQSHGDLIQAIRLDVSKARGAASACARMGLELALALGYVAGALWVSPRLFLIVFVALPLAAAPILLLARRAMRRSFTMRRRASAMYDSVLQVLRGIRVIKVFGGEETERAGIERQARDYFADCIEIARVESLSWMLLESIAGLSIVVVVIVAGFEVLHGRLLWPSLLAFLLAVRSLQSPLHNINAALIEVQTNVASIARLSALLEERPEIADTPGSQPLPRAPQSVSFENVGFGYAEQPVLSGLSFTVSGGEVLGIAGPSGAGKTTLLGLLARFYDPSEGRIRWDGTGIRDLRLADLHAAIALVPQVPFLFSGTVDDNIRAGRPAASPLEVLEAARAAEIHADIEALPQGYQTVVGPGGRALSEGQAQRINVARAFLKNAPILLLDEATSSLDSLSEAKLQRAVQAAMKGRTTFVVAHRLSTLRHASRILVLREGRMVGFGSHAELLVDCPLYAEMWNAQHNPAVEQEVDL